MKDREQGIEIKLQPAVRSPLYYLDAVSPQLTLICLVLLATFWKTVLQPAIYNHITSLSTSQYQEREIDQCLVELLTLCNADRAMLIQFTNGVFTIARISVKGIYPSNEMTRGAIRKVSAEVLPLAAGCANLILNSLAKQPFQKREARILEDSGYRAFLAGLDVDYAISYLLCGRDQALGFVALHYCNSAGRLDWDSVTALDMQSSCDRITGILFKKGNFWDSFFHKLMKMIGTNE